MSLVMGVIFDLDGCLVDSEPLSLEAIASEMRMLGIKDATAQEIGNKFLGVAMPLIADYVSGRLDAPVPDNFVERVETRLLATYQNELRHISGSSELLSCLKAQGCAMAIATGGSMKRMAATLEISGLTSWFEGTASSVSEVAQGKPAPDIFLLALDRLRMKPSECVVLEDSPHGVKGALAAGIPAIGFVGGSHLEGKRDLHASILRDAGAAHVFERLEDFGRHILAQSKESQR